MTRTAEDRFPRLIEALNSAAASHASTGMPLEMAFLASGQRGLQLKTQGRTRELKAHFAHAIVRNPEDLRLHVQRLILYAESRDPAILGALWDLFQVLGDRGEPLRRRMLTLARPCLHPEHYQLFQRRLERDTPAQSDPPPALQGSVLDSGITGATRLISKLTKRGARDEDPLHSAREQLEYGQTALAQATLEMALHAEPSRLELHLALLEIYRHSRDLHHIESVWQSLQGRQNPAATEWRRLLRQLKEEA